MVLTAVNCKSVRSWLTVIAILWSPASLATPAQIAIVIDDMGYRQTDIAAIALEGDFTYSIVPFAPLTQTLAQAAYNNNKEIMVHIPMEATTNNHLLGAGAITAQMNKSQLIHQLKLAISNVPHARGINNHMGSKLTTLPQPIHWIMEQLSQSQLYFLDSKTSASSIGEAIAAKFGLKTGHRDVFLDNQRDHASIKRQFDQLIKIAKKNKVAIAIAHPHPETVNFLSKIQRQLTRHNIELVPLSKILPNTTKLAKAKLDNLQSGANYPTAILAN